jgi:transglutaminase-like putative cysteine protease
MTILTVKHVTTYSYAAPVRLAEHRMMLRPRDSNDQRLLEATLDIKPRPQSLRWIHDVFDNCVAIANFTGNTRSLRVESNITLEHSPFEGPEVFLEDRARYYPFSYDGEEMPDLARSIERNYADPSGELDRWVQRFLRQGRPTETGTLLMTLTYAIKEGLSYERRTERGTQSPLQTLGFRRGSCRDFATLMMEAARALGFAARFVSGYLYVPDRDNGERHLGGGSTHAWCQIYLPGAGWVEFDPTNGIVGNRDLIRVAVAREARQAIPLHGSYFGDAADGEGMVVSVNVRRLPEREPSTTRELDGLDEK